MTTVKFAVVDVGDFLAKKQAAEPDLATDWAKLEELYNKKLWHQLTLKLQDFVKHSTLQKGDNLLQLYSNFLCTFENKVNPLSLVEILAYVVEQYGDKKEAVQFLEKFEPKVKSNDEALSLCKVLQGQIYLEQLNDYESAEKIIIDLEETLEDADGVTPVHARFYKLASEYYRVRGPMAKYYRLSLRYVGCCNGGAALPLPERRQLAFRLALAAVAAPNVYDLGELHAREEMQLAHSMFFSRSQTSMEEVAAPTVYDLGELLVHPILESLEGTEQAWARQLLAAVASGDAAAVDRSPYKPESPQAAQQLRQKIAILCAMEMAFNRTSTQRKLTFSEIAREARVPHDEVELLIMKALAENLIKMAFNRTSTQRKLTFSEIAREARVPHDEVELLIMKALAENLIKGHIDQVSETVHIRWVRPRALGRAGARALAQRLDAWCAAVAAAAGLLTQQAPDLLTL